MSIICSPVEEAINKRAATHSNKEYVRATIDPKTRHQLNLPIDYQFHEVFLGKKYVEFADRFQNFEIRSDDVWICGYPKTGTNWMKNIVTQLNQNLDFDIPLARVMPFEIETNHNESKNEQMEEFFKSVAGNLERLAKSQSPRVFMSHLPAFLLPKQIWTKKIKVIYMARNPKDTSVSSYHMIQNSFDREFSLEKVFQLTIEDEILYAPLPEHILSFWQLRNLDHVLFLTYEELSADRFVGCKKVSQHLGYNYDDAKLQALADFVEFNNMKERFIDVSQFIRKDSNYNHCRKGQVAGYRDEKSQEWVERFDQWICDRFKNTDFDYSQWI